MSNMIQSKIMEHHSIPVIPLELIVDMAGDIIIDLGKVLLRQLSISPAFTHITAWAVALTETKKLDVPSLRSNIPGNSFNHVSSPYITSFPPRTLICASQLSCCARVDVVSDSAKLRITSRKPGTEPVVIAFTRGIVIVGEVACAVYGIATEFEIKLHITTRSANAMQTERYMEEVTHPWVNRKPDRSPYTKSL